MFNLQEGNVEGAGIAGCRVALIADTPKVMTDGNGRVGVLVNDDATDEQLDKSSRSSVASWGPDGRPRAADR